MSTFQIWDVYTFIIGIFFKFDWVEKGQRENYNICNQLNIIRYDSIYISIRLQIRTYKLNQIANINEYFFKL
jgi:hypothetical protein